MIKNKNVAKLLLIVGILCSILGVSYALFIRNLSGTNNNSLTATCFNVSFTDQNNIGLTNTYPLLDEEGKKLTPYEFTVTNNCDTFVKYNINLEVLNTSTLTNMNYIKLMLDDGAPVLVSKYDVTTKALSNASSAYKIKGDLYLDAKESKTYKLRLWLDENVTTETEGVQNKSFASKITVNASYAEEIQYPTAVNYVTTLAKTDSINLATDDYDNIRYIGKSPNNYVTVDGEEYTSDIYYGYSMSDDDKFFAFFNTYDDCVNDTYFNKNCTKVHSKGDKILWRIIGVMKDIDDGTGNKTVRTKIIREESIGQYSWDTSESSINKGSGVNEWSQADIMKLLNSGYESESIGGSLYWNNQTGMCYKQEKNLSLPCNFTSIGIKETLKSLIENAVWNTGANDGATYQDYNILASKFYEFERSTNTGKICTNGDYGDCCNDTVARKTTWTGKVGLMYPSDYGYATSGGSTTDRATCLDVSLYDFGNNEECFNNNWLFKTKLSWTMTPLANPNTAYVSYMIKYDSIYHAVVYNMFNIYPAAYLKPSVKILSGTGSESDPFVLGL